MSFWNKGLNPITMWEDGWNYQTQRMLSRQRVKKQKPKTKKDKPAFKSENYKEIDGYNGRYFISKLGEVKSNCGNTKSLKLMEHRAGLRVNLYRDKKPKTFYVKKLMKQYWPEVAYNE